MVNFTRLFDVMVRIWISGCFVILLFYCLWSLDRGLDLTDESYYLAAAINPDAVTLGVTAMHWMTSALWRLSRSLAGFRGMGLAILMTSSMVLALGTVRTFQMIGITPRGIPTLSIVACSLVGAFLYHAFVPFTPSYNLLTVSGAYVALGLVCLTANMPRRWYFYCLQLLSGIALGIAFLAKFSSGMIVWIIVCSTVAVLNGSFRYRIIGISLITASMAAIIELAVIWHTTFSEALAQFRLGALVYMLGANETFSERLARYFNETGYFLRLIITGFGIPLVLFGFYAVKPRTWAALIGLIAFSYVTVTQGYLLGGMDRYGQQTAPLIVAVILSTLATARLWVHNRKAVYLLGVLAILPFCTAIGTYNALHTQILFSLAPWGVLAGLLAFSIPDLSGRRQIAMLACVLFIMTATSQVLTNGFRAPYRLYRPLQDQVEAITIPPLGTFRVDRETHDSFTKLIQLADSCGIHQGEGFLGLYNIPGVALILQAVPLDFPILQDRLSTEPILDHMAPETLRSAVIGIDRDSGSYDPGMPKQLATFPAHYKLCETVILPYQHQKVELWISHEHR